MCPCSWDGENDWREVNGEYAVITFTKNWVEYKKISLKKVLTTHNSNHNS